MYDYSELPPVMNVPQLGQILKIGRNQAYDLARSDRINSVRIGKQIRIPKHELLKFLGVEDNQIK